MDEGENFNNNEHNDKLEVIDAQRHLERASREYYEAIRTSTPESLVDVRRKLEPLHKFLPQANKVVSVGVGNGEEVHALEEIFGKDGTQIIGLDLSRKAIEIAQERVSKNNLKALLLQGSGIDMPFKEESIDGFVLSAILHEIYSYVPDGKAAWEKGIQEVASKMSENGCTLLRDFAAPQIKGNVSVSFNSDFTRSFYEYFRNRYRTFENWDDQARNRMLERRKPGDPDFPPLDPATLSISLSYGNAAEMMMHFRNFWDNYQRGITTLGDVNWKEIDECYFVPNPTKTVFEQMTPVDCVDTVLAVGNETLEDTPYEIICVQNEVSDRPETADFLAVHFTLALPEISNSSRELIGNTTKKMELVFKKVTKQQQPLPSL